MHTRDFSKDTKWKVVYDAQMHNFFSFIIGSNDDDDGDFITTRNRNISSRREKKPAGYILSTWKDFCFVSLYATSRRGKTICVKMLVKQKQ